LVATAALVVGLGSPTETLVAKALLVAPAVFGALAVIPVFLVGRRLAGRGAALFGVAVLALLPGTFLQRTTVGFADHNGVEPLFMGLAVVGLLVAFSVADAERPVWELVQARDVDDLRRPAVWAVLAGVATALYMWVWPPGVLLVGILGVYVLVKLTSDYVNDISPDHAAFAAAVSMGVTAVLMLVPLQKVGFAGATDFSLLQVFIPLAVAATAVALAAIARVWDVRDLPTEGYPAAVGGIVVIGIAFLALVLPDLYGSLTTNFFRFVGFSQGAETRTISEAQPYLAPQSLRQLGYVTQSGGVDRLGRLLNDYGFTLFTGVVAAVWLMAKPLVRDGDTRKTGYVAGALALVALIYLVPGFFAAIGDVFGVVSEIVGLAVVAALVVGATLLVRYDAEDLFVIVWAAFITSAAFTQVRFNYYLALVVAVMNAYLLGQVLSYLDLTSIADAVEDIEGYQVLVVVAVILLVLTPTLVVPMQVRNTGTPQFDESSTAWQAASNARPGGYTEWQGSLVWLANNTPAEGNYGGAGNADELDYYGRYQRTSDYRYPEGAYGVMSWWDYGHWITVTGHRIPNANPFQEGATTAANYLLAPNTTQARNVLASQSTEGEQTRYVMVDWQMATPGSKFGAPVIFYNAQKNVTTGDFYRLVYRDSRRYTRVKKQRFYESQMTRLYYFHGSAQEPQPVVVDWERARTQSGRTVNIVPQGNESTLKTFRNMEAARAFVRNDSTSQIGGIGGFPAERVPAMEHYRLVHASESSALNATGFRNIRARSALAVQARPSIVTPNTPAFVKTFERVPGATIRGTNAIPNTTVSVRVEMRVPSANSTFTYTQQTTSDAEGNFNLTVPYATTGYDEYGPREGYTDVSVRATGPYEINGGVGLRGTSVVRANGTVHVPEGDVVGAQDGVVRVELTRSERSLFGGNNTSAGNASAGGGNNTSAGASSGTGNDTSGNASSIDAPPAAALTGTGAGADASGTHGGGARPATEVSAALPSTPWLARPA
ncbi:MAG: oligosaccharyl transferase, archaeosortase A system-associated, partial [Haloarculaceae archaeon]